MATDEKKTQIGIRLSAKLLKRIDRRRHHLSRAEYCRRLIRQSLSNTSPEVLRLAETLAPHLAKPLADSLVEILVVGLPEKFAQPLEQFGAIHQATLAAERDTAQSVADIRQLRHDLATAVVGILTKIGQAVRQEDQRPFAREKAEEFVRRVLLSIDDNPEDEP